jgi:hypothetical protein
MWRAFQNPAGYPWILGIVDLRPLWGRHAYKASMRSALPDFLQLCSEIWMPLHFVWSRPWLSFLLFFEHQTSHAAYFNAQRLLYESVSDALLFCSSYWPVGKPIFSSRRYLKYFFFFSLFWIIIPAIMSTAMLRYYSMSASLMPSEFFHCHFDLLEVCFL